MTHELLELPPKWDGRSYEEPLDLICMFRSKAMTKGFMQYVMAALYNMSVEALEDKTVPPLFAFSSKTIGVDYRLFISFADEYLGADGSLEEHYKFIPGEKQGSAWLNFFFNHFLSKLAKAGYANQFSGLPPQRFLSIKVALANCNNFYTPVVLAQGEHKVEMNVVSIFMDWIKEHIPTEFAGLILDFVDEHGGSPAAVGHGGCERFWREELKRGQDRIYYLPNE